MLEGNHPRFQHRWPLCKFPHVNSCMAANIEIGVIQLLTCRGLFGCDVFRIQGCKNFMLIDRIVQRSQLNPLIFAIGLKGRLIVGFGSLMICEIYQLEEIKHGVHTSTFRYEDEGEKITSFRTSLSLKLLLYQCNSRLLIETCFRD
jgi:hypothetical protein